jgi:hypothetical protein
MALSYAPNCSLLIGNTGGNVQSLPDERVGGKTRHFIERLGIPNLLVADQLMVARIPYGSVPLGITVTSDTSFGNGIFTFGDKNNTSRFSASGTLTSTDTPTNKLRASAAGVPITTAYDSAGTSNTLYEDILMTIVTSSLSSGGTFTVDVAYIDYGS